MTNHGVLCVSSNPRYKEKTLINISSTRVVTKQWPPVLSQTVGHAVKRTLLIILALFGLTSHLPAQNDPVFNIKDPGDKKTNRCKEYFEVMNAIPPDVRYTIIERERVIYLVFNSEAYFKQIFDHKTDGFAIDIIHKNQYRCNGANRHADSWAHKGKLLPPIYQEKFAPLVTVAANGVMAIRYGTLPANFQPEDVEYNLLIVQKNWLCDNRYFYNLDFDTWSLLPMGLYRDSVQNPETIPYREVQKTMHFTVPFKKDQTVFEEVDVKPVYDSLNLTDYLIRRIDIRAYSSVEGPLERNIRLQEGRAQSIVNILKAYQNESIQSEIKASENWEQFYEEIADTEFAGMGNLTQKAVKAQLAGNKALLERIEPILSRHRKGEISIQLEKKLNPETAGPAALRQLFAESIAKEELDAALYLQQLIYDRIRKEELPETLVKELTIPESAVYGTLLNNSALFSADNNPDDLKSAISNFEALNNIMPDNPKIRYNLAALKIRHWATDGKPSELRKMTTLIDQLERAGSLAPELVKTLKVNYHIVLTRHYNDERNFAMKNRSLRFIYNEFRKSSLPDDELLRLAKYMTHYSRFDWARALLKSRVTQEGVSTDLIFYYLNLTLADSRNTRRPDYQKVLDVAVARDKQRFCKLFDAKPQGGITFQLLDDPNLKKKFCAQCEVYSTATKAQNNGN